LAPHPRLIAVVYFLSFPPRPHALFIGFLFTQVDCYFLCSLLASSLPTVLAVAFTAAVVAAVIEIIVPISVHQKYLKNTLTFSFCLFPGGGVANAGCCLFIFPCPLPFVPFSHTQVDC